MVFSARIFLWAGFAASFFASAAESSRWRAEESGRSAPVVVPAKGPKETGFSLLGTWATGIAFTNQLAEQRVFPNHNLLNGSGVALGDFDGDGWCDIYLCNLDGPNALYRNLGGWKFEDVTAVAGVATTNQNGTGAVFADVNGDGRLDIVATSLGGPNSLFINQGGGKFVDTAPSAGITSRYGATTAALADVDGNGTLDLYIANYGATSIIRSGGALNVSYVNGQPVVRGRYAQRVQIIGGTMFELGEPDALYLNDGTGKFKAVSWTDGSFMDEDGRPLKEAPWDQGLSAMFRDVNGDRAPDIYVCNDAFTPDRFWINDGKGKFRAMHRLKWRSTSHFSMGVDFADFDRDGDDDFFVLDMHSRDHRYQMTQRSVIPPQPRAPPQGHCVPILPLSNATIPPRSRKTTQRNRPTKKILAEKTMQMNKAHLREPPLRSSSLENLTQRILSILLFLAGNSPIFHSPSAAPAFPRGVKVPPSAFPGIFT